MDIVFSINQLGLEGLGPTLTSLIRHCSSSKQLKLWFFCSELHTSDKENIRELLRGQQFEGTIEYIDFDARKLFGTLKSLHGDWTTYGRLLVAKYVKSDCALYLDADLIISMDVLDLKDFEFEGNLLAAVFGSKVNWVLERSFFVTKLKWSPETDYFNAGVILFNLKIWREFNIEEKWKSLAEEHPNELLAVDQTILNTLCGGKFVHLPLSFNTPWYPGHEKPKYTQNAIIHFVGSPKPWDFTGQILHEGFKTWNIYNTCLWQQKYNKININKIIRTWKIRNSILKCVKQKIANTHYYKKILGVRG